MEFPDEWTQEEFLRAKAQLRHEGIDVILVDTILSPIDKPQSVTYNPFELKRYPKGSVFVFYCDSGKSTKERLGEFRKRFAEYHCVSLRGGKGYWRKNMSIAGSD
jgi:hypothetical protein